MQKIIQVLSWGIVGIAMMSLSSHSVCASERKVPLSFEHSFAMSPTPLTNAGVWSSDPYEKNPHLRKWVLKRTLELQNLEPVEGPSGVFGVSGGVLHSKVEGMVRKAGPEYPAWDEFDCNPEPNGWFATPEGSKVAATEAAALWEKQIEKMKLRLDVELSRIRENDSVRAVKRADHIFQSWKRWVEREWKSSVDTQARMAEWRSYLMLGKELPICLDRKKGKKTDRVPPTLVLEKPGAPRVMSSLLARAPARRWNGLYSVRVELDWGGVRATGQFLVDSGSAQSAVSLDFLDQVGVPKDRALLFGKESVRVSWAGGEDHARTIKTVSTRVAGLEIPVKEFLVLDTALFSPPRYVASCCDGILGMDFIRNFAVEFKTQDPPALLIWPREGFNAAPEYAWVETSTSAKGEWMSPDCSLLEKTPQGQRSLKGVRWDTGSDGGVELHRPHHAWLNKKVELRCGQRDGLTLMSEVPLQSVGAAQGPFNVAFPAVNIGMEFLQRGSFILDPSNGRFWVEVASLDRALLTNQSGLDLIYRENGSRERELVVKKITPKSPASELQREGLKVGSVITEFDEIPVSELDEWQVLRRLSGAYGKKVIIQWQTAAGPKLSSFQLKN